MPKGLSLNQVNPSRMKELLSGNDCRVQLGNGAGAKQGQLLSIFEGRGEAAVLWDGGGGGTAPLERLFLCEEQSPE